MLGCEAEQVRLLLEPRFDDDDDATVEDGSELKVNAEDVARRAAPATTAVAMALRLTWHFVMTRSRQECGAAVARAKPEQGDVTSRWTSPAKAQYISSFKIAPARHNASPVSYYAVTQLREHLESYYARNKPDSRER